MEPSFSDINSARVLVIDDDPAIHRLIAHALRALPLQIECVADGTKALASAAGSRPDLILLDHHLGEVRSTDLLRAFQHHPTLSQTPVIVVTGDPCPEVLADCFALGAIDYVRKPILPLELTARVRNALLQRQLVVRLQKMAMHDTLTGLANRSAILQSIQNVLDEQAHAPPAAPAANTHTAVLFLDFDRFKTVNDSLGHEAGDLLLNKIAGRLADTCRHGDWASRGPAASLASSVDGPATPHTPARLGGDEFVVLLKGLKTPHDAEAAARRFVNCFAEPYDLNGHQVYSTASIGVVSCLKPYTQAGDVLRDADAAMYAAKSAGKSRYVLFNHHLQAQAANLQRAQDVLRDAVDQHQITAYFQPVLDLRSPKVIGCEALARWCHPTRGLLGPEHFIDLADDSGLILPLGEQILSLACRQWRVWQASLGKQAPAQVFVNLSSAELKDPNLPERIQRVIDAHHLPAGTLCLEINESIVMAEPFAAAETLKNLRQAGAQISLDDFGTGPSSLNCLQHMPLDMIKLDRTLIANIHLNRADAALPAAVITLAKNLQIRVIAEGVEIPAQLDALQRLGCTHAQGRLFAPPVPADQIPSRLLPAPLRVLPTQHVA